MQRERYDANYSQRCRMLYVGDDLTRNTWMLLLSDETLFSISFPIELSWLAIWSIFSFNVFTLSEKMLFSTTIFFFPPCWCLFLEASCLQDKQHHNTIRKTTQIYFTKRKLQQKEGVHCTALHRTYLACFWTLSKLSFHIFLEEATICI